MSSLGSLRSLEIIIESFLTRAVTLKEQRLGVLDGLSRLDDITRAAGQGDDVSDQVAEWIANRRDWPSDTNLRMADRTRVDSMLEAISKTIGDRQRLSPAHLKVSKVIREWRLDSRKGAGKLILRHGPEQADPKPVKPTRDEANSIEVFGDTLKDCQNLFLDSAGDQKHLLTVLDDTLRRALLQKSKQALLLSAFMIYYLKLGGYQVSPYVKRLKEAERVFKEASANA